MSFIPSIARHAAAAAAAASHDISSSSSDEGEEESVSEGEEEEAEPAAAAAAAAASNQESAKIEEETLKLKKSLKESRPIYEDYLMPESGRASSESGSEPDRLRKKPRRRSNSAESESEADRFRREIREEVQREIKAALNVKAEKGKPKKPEGGQASGSKADRRSTAGGTSTKSLSEKAIAYKVEKPKQSKSGGLSYKYQKQLATCVRQLVQLGDKINAIAQSADKRN